MTIVASGQISLKSVADEEGLPAVNLSLSALSSSGINALDPTPRVPANTSTSSGNRPDGIIAHRLSEFYAYNAHYTTTTTTTTRAPTTTTTTAATTTTTTTAPSTTTTTRAPTTTTTAGPTTTTTSTEGPTTTTTTQPITWSVSGTPAQVNEGWFVTFTVTTTGIPDGTPYWFTTTQLTGKVTGDTFGPPNYSMYGGPLFIYNNTGSFVRNIVDYPASGPLASDAQDDAIYGPETFNVKIRTGYVGGPVVATSNVISIIEPATTTTTTTTTRAPTTTTTVPPTTTTTTLAQIAVTYDFDMDHGTCDYNGTYNTLSIYIVGNPTPIVTATDLITSPLTVMVPVGSFVYAILIIKDSNWCPGSSFPGPYCSTFALTETGSFDNGSTNYAGSIDGGSHCYVAQTPARHVNSIVQNIAYHATALS